MARRGGGFRFQMQVLRFKNTYIYISTSQKVYTVVTVLSILRLALYVCFIRGPSLVAVSFHGHQKLVPTSRVGGHSNGQAVKFNGNLVKTFQTPCGSNFFDPDSRTVALPKKSLPCSGALFHSTLACFQAVAYAAAEYKRPFFGLFAAFGIRIRLHVVLLSTPMHAMRLPVPIVALLRLATLSLSSTAPSPHHRVSAAAPSSCLSPPLTLSQQQQAAAVSHPQRASGVDARHTNSRKMNTKQLHSAASATSTIPTTAHHSDLLLTA